MILNLLDRYYERYLPDGIGLFERGKPEDAQNDTGFILRVNRITFFPAVLPRTGKTHRKAKTILVDGTLGPHAELVVFGIWMIHDNMPGCSKRRGKRPNLRTLLKVTAAAFAAWLSSDEVQANQKVRTSDVAEYWRICFAEVATTSDHSSALRSLRLILPEYLEHLKTGHLAFEGVKITGSPVLTRLERALKTGKPVSTPHVPSATAPVAVQSVGLVPSGAIAASSVAALTSFEIALRYSSPAAEAEYRNLAATSAPLPSLGYTILPLEATNTTHQLRADRAGRVVLTPDFDVKMIRAKALIDRIAFTVTTKSLTDYRSLQKAISVAIGPGVYVADRTIRTQTKSDWLDRLPVLDLKKLTGYHFAVQLQEPTPTNLRAALDAIEALAGIDGNIRPCLLELAIDLYPRQMSDPVAAILTREQIVGLAQRHVWSAGIRFLTAETKAPRTVDPRQVYFDGKGIQTRYLFADGKKQYRSDHELQVEAVRRRLLTGKPGNELYLNATIYRGDDGGQHRTNIQHKIADRRNPSKGTKLDLPDQERRTRMEVTLTSFDALEQAGLKTLEDLATVRFRKMFQKVLSFRLPTCHAGNQAITETIAQFQNRGVHGVEMSQRAKLHEDRIRQTPRPRKIDREGLALTDWMEMNALVGDAVDRLGKTWRRF